YNLHLREFSNSSENIVRKSLYIPDISIIDNGDISLIDRFKSLPLKNESKKFIFHSSYNTITSNKHALQVCTIHDFVHERFYSGIRRTLHKYQKTKAINRAGHIIVISNNTKNDLLNMHPHIDPLKVSVIYNGASDDFFPLMQQAEPNTKPFILFIGSREHYKNFNFCIKLLREVKGFELKIIGSSLKKSEIEFLNKNIPNRWNIETNIPNSSLNKFYNEAFAVLYPSSYEGFGIPILEAMKAGTPFIALNKSSIPEVAGDAGILVDELDIEFFKAALNEISVNRKAIIEKGFVQSKKFSWDSCFNQTVKVYNDLYNL
ncbi:glycosyltransferase family 1 protein, partial [bacterium]